LKICKKRLQSDQIRVLTTKFAQKEGAEMILEDLYCQVDDFCQAFMPKWHESLIDNGLRKKPWSCQMSGSEIMTIIILFHQQKYRDFKTFYTKHVQVYWRKAFPKLLSYSRFVEQMKSVTLPLFFFMMDMPKIKSGVYFIDSTTLKVCHIKREKQHKVFQGTAKKSKSTMGWFYGFKLHIIVNSRGEIMNLRLTDATTDDRNPVLDLTDQLFGKLVGDKGYLSKKLKETLLQKGIELITKIRKNMKKQILADIDKLLLRKRAIVESVIDQLKNISQIEHSRHRSQDNFLVNLIAGLTAYSLQPKKPSIEIDCSGIVVV
jgi:hypothetical protein